MLTRELIVKICSDCRGLGLDRLFLKFLKLYSDPHNLVLVVNTSSAQEVSWASIPRNGRYPPTKEKATIPYVYVAGRGGRCVCGWV